MKFEGYSINTNSLTIQTQNTYMTKYEVNFEVQDHGTIGFEVNPDTFDNISKFCQENFPEYNWQILKQ